MPREVVEIQITRQGNHPWGFRLVGGSDTGLVLKVEKVRNNQQIHYIYCYFCRCWV